MQCFAGWFWKVNDTMADISVVLKQTFRTQQIRNVLTFNNFNFPEPELQEFADAIRAGYLSTVNQYQVNEWSLDGIDIIYNDSLPIFSISQPFTLGPLVGGSTGVAVINQAALLVSLQSNNPPPNRGRIYFGGLVSGEMGDNGFWSGAIRDAYQLMVDGWKDGIATTNSEFFLRIGRKDATGVIIASTPVTSVQGRTNPAVQRRRRIGQGI